MKGTTCAFSIGAYRFGMEQSHRENSHSKGLAGSNRGPNGDYFPIRVSVARLEAELARAAVRAVTLRDESTDFVSTFRAACMESGEELLEALYANADDSIDAWASLGYQAPTEAYKVPYAAWQGLSASDRERYRKQVRKLERNLAS